MYVFGYGSLVSPISAGRTLGRYVEELPAARLRGHRRDWGVGVPLAFDDGTRATGAFLDVQPDTGPGSVVLGTLLAVSPSELVMLEAREAQYDTVEVTAEIESESVLAGPVFAFMGRAEHRADPDLVLPSRYLELVTLAVATRGEAFAEEYWATTAPTDLPRHDGPYRFADPIQERAARP